MGSQSPNNRENGIIWHLPELQGDRSELVLEMRHHTTINAKEIGRFNAFTRIKNLSSSQANTAEFIGWYVCFSQPSESSKFIRGKKRLEKVFSLPSESSTLNVFHQFPEERVEEEHETGEEEGHVEKSAINDNTVSLDQSVFIDMQQYKSRFEEVSRMKLELMKQEHGANRDYNLLKDESRSMKANVVSASNTNFIGSDNAIVKHRTPLGNTVSNDQLVSIDMRKQQHESGFGSSTLNVFHQFPEEREKEQHEMGEEDEFEDDEEEEEGEILPRRKYKMVSKEEIPRRKYKRVPKEEIPRRKCKMTLNDMRMQQHRPRPEVVSHMKPELMKQEHGANRDYKLLKDEYRSMKANVVFAPNTNFIGSDNAIVKQRTPLGNTVLHIRTSHGNDAMVEEVAEHAPKLFTVVNDNYDTALHVAARKGHGSTIQLLLKKFLLFVRRETNGHDHQSILETMLMISLTLFRNKQGNTFLHEAFMTSSHNGAAIFKAFGDTFISDGSSDKFEDGFIKIVNYLAPFAVNLEGKSLLYLAIKANCAQVVEQLMDFCIEYELKPQGKSPFLPTLIDNNFAMLETILKKKPDWVQLRNEQGWLPLHHAALLGHLQGVRYLVKECHSSTMERDNNGCLPIHLACIQGHVKIVQELLKWCLDPAEMVNGRGQNLLHVACACGDYELVRYLLEDPKLEIMINQKDFKGNTPLHLATESWQPKIVHALTWDNRVDLSLLNHENLTALDVAEVRQHESVSLSQRLTWNALISAKTPRSSVRFYSHDGTKEVFDEPHTNEQYKDRIDSLIVVSTLIITTSFAAGFTFPGDADHGIPILLNRPMFHLFILTLTISVFGAISSTIILLWARLGSLHLAVFSLTWAIPLLGLSLMTLALAFLAGMYLIVSKLSWLATTFLVIGVVLILMIVFLYTLLLLPFPSTIPFFRYISYYPFLFFAKIAEGKMEGKKMGSKVIIPVL